jgi:hypothetical protein
MEMLLWTQVAALPRDSRLRGRAGVFLYTEPVPARRYGQRTVRTPGRILSHRDLPSMTDYRVPIRSLT